MNADIGLVLGGVALVKGRNRASQPVLIEIAQEINPILSEGNFLKNAPFEFLNGVIRYGIKFDPIAQIGPIDKHHNELPFSVEVEMSRITNASKAEIKEVFLAALFPALLAIAEKYGLPKEPINAYFRTPRQYPPFKKIEGS